MFIMVYSAFFSKLKRVAGPGIKFIRGVASKAPKPSPMSLTIHVWHTGYGGCQLRKKERKGSRRTGERHN